MSRSFHENPGSISTRALAYMSCEILQQAVAKAGLDQEKLREAIASTTFDTINGPVKFEGVENVTTPTALPAVPGRQDRSWSGRPRSPRRPISRRRAGRRPDSDRGGDRGVSVLLSGQLLFAALSTGALYALIGARAQSRLRHHAPAQRGAWRSRHDRRLCRLLGLHACSASPRSVGIGFGGLGRRAAGMGHSMSACSGACWRPRPCCGASKAIRCSLLRHLGDPAEPRRRLPSPPRPAAISISTTSITSAISP